MTVRLSSMALLMAAWAIPGQQVSLGQSPQQQVQRDVELSGRVVTRSNAPVSSAHVTLRSLETSTLLSTVTESSGKFTFKLLRPGTYTVTCTRGTLQSQSKSIVLRGAAIADLRMILDDGKSTGPNPESHLTLSHDSMEFSDKPDFTVAGVTDWTAVGGHGSDATLRTSEDLTRETLALKTPLSENNLGSPPQTTGSDEIENKLRATLATAPHDHAASHDLGMYYLQLNRFQLAIPLLQAASKLDGEKAQDEYDLALACEGLGAFDQARVHVQRALAQTDSASFHRLLGDLDEKLGDPLSAVKQLEQATQLEPSEENYFDWASELLLHRAIWQAAEVFANGTKAHPSSVRLKTGRGAALFSGALYDEAAQQLCEASDLDPAAAEPYLFLGKLLSASQAPPACVDPKLERFLTLQPTNADANYFYAMLLLKQGSPQREGDAEALFRKAVAADPNYSDAYLQLGILASIRKNYAEALDCFLHAIHADPQFAEAHYRLGVAYDRIGKDEAARQQFTLHDQIEKAKADATEQERKQVKQFLIVLKGDHTGPEKL